ncbi:MAG TPA: glucosamine-6-phosphate deaminase [Ferruginibacter sp.]|nr:glucosamine-6-phosphate deaminase [Ferruginibacter sp.]HMP20012.1 glucosamine-6-phosphate deaminase [Ferruginibacter sp.]
MTTICLPNYYALSDYTAQQIVNTIKEKPNCTICMASGHTPAMTADLLVKKLQREKIDYSTITFLGLDEWAGLDSSNTGSCAYFFQQKIFKPLQLPSQQYHLFNALAADLQQECAKMDALISSNGGIDIMVVGIGMNGHIGFNEPGTPFDTLCHIATLDDTTKTVGQKYFSEHVKLQQGITIGLGHLLQSKKAILMANGQKKAEVIYHTVHGTVSERFPASVMQQHAAGFIITDTAAASLLKKPA